MKVTYLGHSGFLTETERACYLFDYIRGTIPNLPDGKPLYIFASHFHKDHFSPQIFQPSLGKDAVRYILSYDIRRKYRNCDELWMREYQDKICWARPGQTVVLPDCLVTPIKSTDVGVAYLAEEKDYRLFHAGDLNWWHWEGESLAWNRNMEVNFKREIDRLKNVSIDLAFMPLDPRQEGAYWYGMEYFLRTVPVKTVFPMHFWEDYSVIDRYLAEHGGRKQIQKIEREGQEYEI